MQYRVYIKPFDDTGTYLSDFIEVTKDVVSISDISQKIDSSEFDVGIIRNSGVSIVLRNEQGYYSDVTALTSIFRYKRKNSIVKVTWSLQDTPNYCGFTTCGEEVLGDEITLFEGVLNEISSSVDISKQQVTFQILGYESLLDEIETPFADISNGDNISEVILTMLAQPPFNTLVTVHAMNVGVGFDTTVDVKDSLETNTVGENLKNLLLAANAVLYIIDNTVYVSPRDETPDLKFSFYGQASIVGIENIINIPKYREGLNRTFNYWVWPDTDIISKDVSSIALYGALKKEFGIDIITNNTKRADILDANREEFAFPKAELDLETPLLYETWALNILDKVQVDYPTVYSPADNNPLPRYGAVVYGTSRYPYGQFTLTIDSSRRFKILSKKLNKRKNTILFTLREV